MPPTLEALESQRSGLLEEFLRLGDLRPGSITAVVRRCGKPSCHCARPNDPGHDPPFRLTRRVAGKSVTESFPSPAALRKAQQEVAEFHRFQKLGEDLVGVNEKMALRENLNDPALGRFPEDDEFGLRRSHSLGFQEKVAKVLIPAATAKQ